MLPVLSARESLTAVTRHALGSGLLERGDQYRVRSQWESAAQLSPQSTEPPSEADLLAMGVDPRKARVKRG